MCDPTTNNASFLMQDNNLRTSPRVLNIIKSKTKTLTEEFNVNSTSSNKQIIIDTNSMSKDLSDKLKKKNRPFLDISFGADDLDEE